VHKIRSRTAAGATILVASRLITRCIDLGTLVILGRLLSPADFGVVAIAMSVIAIVEAIMELPLGLALVALPTRTEEHYATAFTLQLVRGLLLAVILLALAWPIARIYNDPRLLWLLCALGVAPIARGLSSAKIVEYTMNFQFLPNLIMEVFGKLVSLVLSVSLAWLTKSYWALAIGTIATPIAMLVTSYCYAPYLPTISLSKWRDFVVYLRWTTASQAVTALVWQMDQLMLGRFVDRVELGRFSMAANLSVLPTQIFVAQIVNPLTVAFASVREDLARLRGAYQKSANSIVAIGLPIMVGMSVNAEPIIRLVVGEKWLAAAPILRWLSLAMIPGFFVGPISPLAITLNRTSIFLRLIVVELCIKFPLMLIGLIYYGVMGVVASRVITALAIAGCTMLFVRELIGLRIRDQVFGPWRSLLSSVVMALGIALFQSLIASGPGLAQLILYLAIVVSIGAVVYVGSMFSLWLLAGRPDGLEFDVMQLLTAYAHRFRRVSAN